MHDTYSHKNIFKGSFPLHYSYDLISLSHFIFVVAAYNETCPVGKGKHVITQRRPADSAILPVFPEVGAVHESRGQVARIQGNYTSNAITISLECSREPCTFNAISCFLFFQEKEDQISHQG